MVKARSQFKRRSTANNVEIIVPVSSRPPNMIKIKLTEQKNNSLQVPSDADSPKFRTTTGNCKWLPEKSAVSWQIKSFPGGKEFLMRASFGLPSVESDEIEGKPPIQVRCGFNNSVGLYFFQVKFEIPYFTVSGIQVRYLKIIEKSGYQALPWVRYITQNGDYQLRTNT